MPGARAAGIARSFDREAVCGNYQIEDRSSHGHASSPPTKGDWSERAVSAWLPSWHLPRPCGRPGRIFSTAPKEVTRAGPNVPLRNDGALGMPLAVRAAAMLLSSLGTCGSSGVVFADPGPEPAVRIQLVGHDLVPGLRTRTPVRAEGTPGTLSSIAFGAGLIVVTTVSAGNRGDRVGARRPASFPNMDRRRDRFPFRVRAWFDYRMTRYVRWVASGVLRVCSWSSRSGAKRWSNSGVPAPSRIGAT